MKTKERKQAVESLKEICQIIGCSGIHPDLCQNRPHQCEIIRKIVKPRSNTGGIENAKAERKEAKFPVRSNGESGGTKFPKIFLANSVYRKTHA